MNQELMVLDSSGADIVNPFEDQTEESLCSEIKKIETDAEYLLRRYHKQWFYQVAMRMGCQWLQNHPDGYTVMPVKNVLQINYKLAELTYCPIAILQRQYNFRQIFRVLLFDSLV